MLNRRQAVLMQVSLGQLMLRFMGRSSINKRPVGRLLRQKGSRLWTGYSLRPPIGHGNCLSAGGGRSFSAQTCVKTRVKTRN
jgi:hypothetical protein